MNRVGANIKKLRTMRGMTQDALAETLHVVRQTVSLWETGKREPDIDTLIAIADALGAEVTELIYGPKPADDFAAGKRRRITVAAIFVGLFLLLLLADTIVKPPLIAFLNSNYKYPLLRLIFLLVLPVLLYTFGGIAIAFSLSVFQDLRIRRLWLRAVLLLFVFLVTGLYLIFLFWMQPWYFRIFEFLAHSPILFLPPGLALGFALNR